MEYLKPSNLLNLIVSPTKVFQKVKEKQDFLVLIFLIPLISALSMLFIPRIPEEALLEYVKRTVEDPELQKINLKTLKMTTSPAFLAGSEFLHYIISFFITAFILLMIVRLAGGEIDFKKALTIVAVANIVMIPYYVFYAIYARAVNLNILDVSKDFKYFIATYLNIFSIWRYVLIGIGVFAVCELNKVKSTIVTTIYAIITLIVPVAMLFIKK